MNWGEKHGIGNHFREGTMCPGGWVGGGELSDKALG